MFNSTQLLRVDSLKCWTDKIYKATKTNPNGDVKSNGKATVENGDDDDDMEAGPEMPPKEEEAGPEDEEGRFFGGGITKNTTAVLDFIDDQDKDEQVSRKKYLGSGLRAETDDSNRKRLTLRGCENWP